MSAKPRMNVLILGSGGREHALAWKTAQSPRLGRLYIAPGNPGTAEHGENVPLSLRDHAQVIRFCQEKGIDLVLVGPEAPLAEGIADSLAEAGIRCFGPSQAAAQIEASKVFAKHFMARHGIPTARYATFDTLSQALAYLEQADYPIVIKASGLAAGKGVLLPETKAEAQSVLREMLEARAFGAAGREVVIEERLEGVEISLMAFTDGETVIPMLAAQDHKRIFDDDQGPNTGGMGAYAPAPVLTTELRAQALEQILKPAVAGLRQEGRPFVGVLYAGLMLTPQGLRVLEFNSRFGDPETQAVLPLLETDLLEIAEACVGGRLAKTEIRWRAGAAVCVVLAAKGYPEAPETGQSIAIGALPDGVVCFHAGTKTDAAGRLVTAGGRVLGVTAYAANLLEATQRAYDAVEQIEFEGMQYRTDIAFRALEAEADSRAEDKTEGKADGKTDEKADRKTDGKTDGKADRKTDGKTDEKTDGKSAEKRISEEKTPYYVSKRIALPTDNLTYRVNGLAMQVHNELGPGHPEQFYQRRLAELCREHGLAVEMEKRVEVQVAEKRVGYLKIDLWIEERLVVECKAFSHPIGQQQINQVIAYLTATASRVGMLYNFGRRQLYYRRILAPVDVKQLYRVISLLPGISLPSLDERANIPPIRFNAISSRTKLVEIPGPTGASLRYSIPASASSSASAYSASGVSIDAGNRAVELMKSAVQSTYGPAVLAGIGSFGGLFDAALLKQMNHPVLVASTDGVGTKVKLAAQTGRYRGIGHDIVNHCIDDILVQGARPLFFLDYFATSRLNPEQTADIVTGMAEACRAAGIALLGGETAEMPGVYQPGEFDVAGTIVGVLERERILPRVTALQAGDVLLGLRSSGPHTNGYSLLRKVFAETPLETVFPELGIPLADALLAPHRSYLHVLEPVLDHPGLKALAHLTGGGFIENIPRILPEHLSALIHIGSWPMPPLWNLVQQKGGIAHEEMYRVFNMGIGMVAVVDATCVSEIQARLPEETFVIGELIPGARKTILH